MRAIDHDLRGAERVAAVEQVHLGREAGQVGRLLERGVAAADDGDLAVLEEEAVAGRAGRHAAATQPRLAVEAEPQRRRAGGDDHGLGAVFGAARPDAERPLGEVDAVDVDVDEARAEPLGLGAHRGHQVGALDAVREARVVLDVAGQHQLAAGRGARQHDRLEVGAGGVDRGGQPGRAGADDDDLRVDPVLAAANGRWATGLLGRRSSSTIEIQKPPNGVDAVGRHRSCRSYCIYGRACSCGMTSRPDDLERRPDRAGRAHAHDDVLGAGVGQVAEAVDDLRRRSRSGRRSCVGMWTLWRVECSISSGSRPTAAQCSARIAYLRAMPSGDPNTLRRRRTGPRGAGSSSRRRRRP